MNQSGVSSVITFRKFHLLALTALTFVSGCSGNGSNFGSANNKGDQSDEDNEDESADPPEVVTGAYLTCVDTNDAAADEISYGCNLNKSNGRQIKLPDVATNWKWLAVPPKGSSKVKLSDRSASGDRAIFIFSGSDKDELKTFAEDTQVSLTMSLKKDVPGYKPFRSKIKDAGPLGSSSAGTGTSNPGPDTKLKIPDASPAGGTVSGVEPIKLPELPPSIPDRDKDGVADADDLCNNTPPGSTVWKDGEWRGCSGGEYKDKDDTDMDRVSNSVDICPASPKGAQVDRDPASPTYGCGPTEIIF